MPQRRRDVGDLPLGVRYAIAVGGTALAVALTVLILTLLGGA